MEPRKMLEISETSIVLFLAICLAALLEVGTAHPTSELISTKRDTSDDSILTLVSVEREPTPNGNKFTVRYTKHVDNLLCRVQDNMNAPREPSVTQEANGVWAASFVVPVIPQTSQWFIMRDSTDLHMVALQLNNSDTSPGIQNIPELPVISFDLPNEAVYSPNQDVHLQVRVPRNNQTGQVVDNMQKMFYGVDLQTMGMHLDFDDDGAFTIGHPETLGDMLQVSITAHTSQSPMSGYLQLSTQVLDTGGTLLKQIQVSRSVLVRPAGQTGPFPAGYVSFLGGGEIAPSGHELRRCSVGYECLIRCASVGSSISSIDVKQIDAYGLHDVPSAEVGVGSSATSKDIFWKFRAEVDSGDSDGITSFRCKVMDLTHGTVATKIVDVRAEIPGVIDHERSGVTVEDDYMDPHVKILNFKCAIRGRPLPEVTFYAGTTWQFNIYASPPDDVTSTGQNEAVATRVVTVDATDLAQAMQLINAGQNTGPSCGIYSSYYGNYTTHEFYPSG